MLDAISKAANEEEPLAPHLATPSSPKFKTCLPTSSLLPQSAEASPLTSVEDQQEQLSSLSAGSRDLNPPGELGGSSPLSAGSVTGQSVVRNLSADTANPATGQDHLDGEPRTEKNKRTPSSSAAPSPSQKTLQPQAP